jgi:hypothetical protein
VLTYRRASIMGIRLASSNPLPYFRQSITITGLPSLIDLL